VFPLCSDRISPSEEGFKVKGQEMSSTSNMLPAGGVDLIADLRGSAWTVFMDRKRCLNRG